MNITHSRWFSLLLPTLSKTRALQPSVFSKTTLLGFRRPPKPGRAWGRAGLALQCGGLPVPWGAAQAPAVARGGEGGERGGPAEPTWQSHFY